MIAVGFNGQIIRSTNGTTWVGTTLGVIEYDKVAYGAVLSPSQNLFLLNGPDRIVQQDSPGVNTWSLVTTATGLTDLQDLDVDSGSALWVAVGGTNGGGPAEVAYRSGGTGGAYTRYTVTGEKLWSIGFGNGVWIGGADAGTIYRAVDPTAGAGAWSQISTPSANRINDVAHLAGDKWVGVASGGDIVFSEDNGVSWESRTSPTAGILAGVAFDASNQQIVAVGEDGLVIGSGTEDPPLIVVPTPDPLIPAKDDYAEEAVGRLISLFRS